MTSELKPRYDVKCSECGHEFQAAPSLAMKFGENTGHGTCSKCKTFLRLTLDDNQERMLSEKWSALETGGADDASSASGLDRSSNAR